MARAIKMERGVSRMVAMTQSNTIHPIQPDEDNQAELKKNERSFPPELGDRAGQPRLWTISRIEAVIGSIA